MELKERGLRPIEPQAVRVIDAPLVRVSVAELLFSRAPLCFPEPKQPKRLTMTGQAGSVKGMIPY